MTAFMINRGTGYDRQITASDFNEVDSLVVFYDSEGNKVFALLSKNVVSIERVTDQHAAVA